jgi:hypothetical protein
MKKVLFLLTLLLVVVLSTPAQYVALKKETFTSVSNGTVVRLIGSAASFHKVTWNKIGTVTVCSLKVEQSATGTSGWSDLITTQDCSVNGTTSIVAATPNYIRTVTHTTFTGIGSVVSVYIGYINNPTGGGGAGTPGGSDTHVQVNDAGVFFGEAGFTYNKTTNVFTFPTPFTLGATSVTTTGTEVNYVAGVTSGIQAQFTAKAPLASPTFTGTVTIPTPFTLGAVSTTTTGTQLNFWNTLTGVSGAGTTGVLGTFTSLASNDVPAWNGTNWVNSVSGLPSRADNDGTAAIATTDRNSVVNVGHATANAVSIAEAGVTAANGFIGGFQFILCTTGTGLTTLTPTTSTVNSYPTFTQRQNECARIVVPTETDTVYRAIIDGGQFTEINVELFAPATATAVGDGAAFFYVGPKLNGMTLIAMYSQVATAGTTNTTNIGLDRCAAVATSNACSGTVADMLTVVQTIDSQENSSNDAATPVTINAANALLTAGQVLRFNVDAVSTIAAKGLQVTLRLRK